MKRLISCASICLAFSIPATALAQTPTVAHKQQYRILYKKARSEFGIRSAGCNLLGGRGSCHRRTTDSEIVKSISVLQRMIAPPPQPVASISETQTPAYPPTTVYTQASTPSGSLTSCILNHESNNGLTSSNVAQFQTSTWLEYGGGQYSSNPSDASYSQQVSVLNHALASGGASNWIKYDHC